MAKGVYVGVGGVAKKVKKLFVGVGGAARKVKKVFVGVGGAAKLAYSAEPQKVPNVSELSVAREYLAGASIGKYAVFAGGCDSSDTKRNTVDAYSNTLIKSTPTALNVARSELEGAANGIYAMFAGGVNISSTMVNTVETYNTSLVRGSASGLYKLAVFPTGGNIGNYVLFVGGKYSETTVNIYDSSAVRSTSYIPTPKANAASANTNSHVIFACGYDTGGSAKREAFAFDASLVHTMLADADTEGSGAAGASVGDYALFAGGNNGTKIVTAYNSSLLKINIPVALDDYISGLAGASLEGYAVFAGGARNAWTEILGKQVIAYDASLVKSYFTDLSVDRHLLKGANIGNYILFAGGYQKNSVTNGCVNTTDAYEG